MNLTDDYGSKVLLKTGHLKPVEEGHFKTKLTMKKIDKSLIENEFEPISDKAHRAVRVAMNMLPFGGSAIEVFNLLIEPPIEKRRQIWMEQVTDALNYLVSEKSCSVQQLTSNEVFIDVLFKTSSVAMKIHKKEKLSWLKNALINSVIKEFDIDEIETTFLRFIEELTVWHIKVLLFYRIPRNHITERDTVGESEKGMIFYIQKAFPLLDEDYIKLIWSELRIKSLITLESST